MRPDSESVEPFASTVKVPPSAGRKKSVPAPLSNVLPAERPVKPIVGCDGAVVSIMTVTERWATLPTLSVPLSVNR